MRLSGNLATCWLFCLQWLFNEETSFSDTFVSAFIILNLCYTWVVWGGNKCGQYSAFWVSNLVSAVVFWVFFLTSHLKGAGYRLCIWWCQFWSVLENNLTSFFSFCSLWRHCSYSLAWWYFSPRGRSFPVKNELYWPRNAQSIHETLGVQELRTLQFTSDL